MRMRMGRRRRSAVVAGGVVLLLAGCASSVGGDPVEDDPVESSAAASSSIGSVSDSVEPFDPCTIPKDAVTATGLDVDTERPDFGGITTDPGWKNCTWDAGGKNPWYYLSVMSTVNSLDRYLRSPQNDRQVPVQVGGRDGVRYNTDYQGDPPTGCDIAVAVGDNLIIFVVDTIGSENTVGDPCAKVTQHASDLQSHLPK